MRTIELNLTGIESREALHIYIAYMMRFPDYYGRNMDALYDMLTEIGKRTHLIVRMGKDDAERRKLRRVLDDAVDENPRLSWEEVD